MTVASVRPEHRVLQQFWEPYEFEAARPADCHRWDCYTNYKRGTTHTAGRSQGLPESSHDILDELSQLLLIS